MTSEKALVLVAHIHAKEGSAPLVSEAIRVMTTATRQEAGCLTYEPNLQADTDGHFMIYEVWENRSSWEAHMETAHIAAFKSTTDGHLGHFELCFYSPVLSERSTQTARST
jgi:quinol monooxygenase YgiN